jgi:hypothetical protein
MNDDILLIPKDSYTLLSHVLQSLLPIFVLFLDVTDQVSHPYKTAGNIVILQVLILTFLNSKL